MKIKDDKSFQFAKKLRESFQPPNPEFLFGLKKGYSFGVFLNGSKADDSNISDIY